MNVFVLFLSWYDLKSRPYSPDKVILLATLANIYDAENLSAIGLILPLTTNLIFDLPL